MADVIRIGNAQAFWGDDPEAPARLAAQAPDLDVLTLDYLAEVSMSILAKQRSVEANLAFPRDFLTVIASLAPHWQRGRRLKLVTNAGGLKPRLCAELSAALLRDRRCVGLKIGVVTGDDVLQRLIARAPDYPHLENGMSLETLHEDLATANAYLGAAPIAEALSRGADIVITGRVADPSLTIGPCLWHFGWNNNDYDTLAGATVAGHLIECGTQVTGGISTDWLDLPDPANIGFPIVEISGDGSCVVTKPAGTGGRVSERTVKEQLLYEIGDPENYLSPDVTASFLGLSVAEVGDNRVAVRGATGRAPPDSYKVSATYPFGFRAAGTLVVSGPQAPEKCRRCGEIVRARLEKAGRLPRELLAECLGGGHGASEVVLRIAAADPRREVVEYFTRQLAPLISSGPQGISGYAEGRPRVHEVFGYWPTLIKRELVRPVVEILEVA
jgi:hypothetical protein